MRRRRILAGVTGLLLLAVVVYAAFVRHVPWADPWSVTAVVTDSAQIRAGAPVRMAGVDVGTVRAVRRGPGTTAELELAVRPEGRPLHADARAAIRPRLFLEGSSYVALSPGTPREEDLGDGGTIPLAQTTVPVSFTSVLSTFDRPVRDGLRTILDESATGLTGGGAQGLRRGLRAAGPAFRDGAVALEAATGTQPGDLARLVAGAARVTNALAADAPALGRAITALNRVAGALAAREADLTAAIRETDATLAAAPRDLGRLRAAFAPTRALARDLTPGLRAAPAALDGADRLLRQLQGLTARRELPAALAALRPTARGVTALSPRLRTLFPRVDRVAACVGDQGVAMLSARLQDGEHTTGQTVWQELAHNGVNLVSLSQNFDAAGTYVRFITIVQPRLLAVSAVPGVGVLLQNAVSETFDARPAWDGPVPPAYHPEVPCGTQPVSEFQAPKATAVRGAGARRVTPTAAALPDVAQLSRTFRRRAAQARREAAG